MTQTVAGQPRPGAFRSVGFFRQHWQPIRSLAGFRKETHRLSDSPSDAFIAQLASQDLERDLDQRYAALKEAFRFKRLDMEVSEPAEGVGFIVTPHFTYQSQVRPSGENPAEVVWQRRVTDIQQQAVVLSDAFAAVFQRVFDTIEFIPVEPIDVESLIDQIEALDDERIRIDYDRAATHCQLSLADVAGEIHVAGEAVTFQRRGVVDPRELVHALVDFQQALLEVQAILPLSFG